LTLHSDLVEQANHLTVREPKKPRQASLRRATSAAYYALFHMLLYEATLMLFPHNPNGLRNRSRRAFTHQEIKNACSLFAKPTGGVDGLTTNPLAPELTEIAQTFVDLQEARHKADYNLAETFDRVQVLGYVKRARDALAKWKIVKGTPNANVFLSALLVNSRWNKEPKP
jgi:hypothetical protein